MNANPHRLTGNDLSDPQASVALAAAIQKMTSLERLV